MTRRATVAVGGAAILVLVFLGSIGLGAVAVLNSFDDDPAASPPSVTERPATPRPTTQTPVAGPSAPADSGPTTTANTDAEATTSQQNYSLTVNRVESCGTTCRDVTATLTNRDDVPRENVTVLTRLSVGGTVLWSQRERVGRLAPGESYTTTARVHLTFDEALLVQQNGGYVTIERTVRSDAGTSVITRRRQVM